MDLVDRVGGGLDRGVEPEGRHRAADVVVDRLRNADDRDALLAEQSLRDAQRAVAADGDGDLQRDGGSATCCISRSTSPGSAWRPTAFFEKIRRPSTSTSNTPPEDWISFTSACGYTLRSSAARPAARGS